MLQSILLFPQTLLSVGTPPLHDLGGEMWPVRLGLAPVHFWHPSACLLTAAQQHFEQASISLDSSSGRRWRGRKSEGERKEPQVSLKASPQFHKDEPTCNYDMDPREIAYGRQWGKSTTFIRWCSDNTETKPFHLLTLVGSLAACVPRTIQEVILEHRARCSQTNGKVNG